MEAVLLLMVGASPWLFGSVHPFAELLLAGGLAVVAMLWIMRIAWERRPALRADASALALGLMCLLAMFQLAPLSASALGFLSPGSARLHSQLLPVAPEILRFDSVALQAEAASRSISVCPWTTRQTLIRLIAALFLYLAIRSNLTSPGTFRRLALVVVVNGVALSLLGLAQWLSSKPNIVFWSYSSEGRVFGPFICRNHFAYYINLSIGLGVGLLLQTRHLQTEGKESRGPIENIICMLQDPTLLWLGAALLVMAAGLSCSLSRGGFGACVLGLGVCIAMHGRHAQRLTHWSSGLVFIVLGAGLIAWLGAGAVGRRIATMWETNVLEEGRSSIWSRCLQLSVDFPVFGSGLGTLRFVEPLTRGAGDGSRLIHEHMHNDYLELLIEGGVLQLIVVLTLVFLVFRIGFQAFRREYGTGLDRLAAGAVFGLTAIAVHSTVDFGMHVPAITLLATTIVALLANLADETDAAAAEGGIALPPRAWFSAGLQIVAILAVGTFLLDQAWRCERAERYRLAAQALGLLHLDKKVAYLEAALSYTPDDPLLCVAAGDAHWQRQRGVLDRAQMALSVAAAGMGSDAAPWPTLTCVALAFHPAAMLPPRTDDIAQSFRHYAAARARCCSLAQPHSFLATYAGQLQRGEAPEIYLQRACLLDPSNADVWYIAGSQWISKDRSQAWECWRRSLECDHKHLKKILRQTTPILDAKELIDLVVPDSPATLFEVYLQLQKMQPSEARYDRCLLKAAAKLEQMPSKEAGDYHLLGQIQARLERVDMAMQSFKQALSMEPKQALWRLEYCELLSNRGELQEARRELLTLLSFNPQDGRAKQLYEDVMRELATRER